MTYSVSELREAFLSFFERHNHYRQPSSPLVPHHDPTLMFTNAGMVPFKHVFSGEEQIKNKQGEQVFRATSSQKCVRAGGKHNDLDNVGYTARHHTFFEMLGNFSFGDYFKEDAIKLAWEFLTKELSIPEEKLYVTVYHTDDEAFEIWKKVSGFPESKILRVPTNDNFWAMGDTGPCGPCSEIFYDHGDKIEGEWKLDKDGYDMFEDRFIEIWNLVFMQFEKHADGSQTNLPKPCIDTGMGLERMAAVMQNCHDNYDTDLFQHLIKASQDASGNDDPKMIVSHRVIADHLRSSCFLISDGVLPSNEGRGYVLRRIMRRAMRHAHILGCKEPLMFRLVPALIREMGEAYPELNRAEALIVQTLETEEVRFKETLGKGLKLLEEETSSLKEGDTLKGETAFKLYDTYGFPYDLTEDILRGKKMKLDEEGFNKAMAEQKAKARASWSGSGDAALDAIWMDLYDKHGASEFLGYEHDEGFGTIQAIVKDGKVVDTASEKDKVQIILNQTPFYGESGGQAGDKGRLEEEGVLVDIVDTKKPVGGLMVHSGVVKKGTIKTGDEVRGIINRERRLSIKANHSATHLLHAVLRKILGEHVTQKGSLVEENSFRFDFSHPQKLTDEENRKIETEVNKLVRQNTPVGTRLMEPDKAIEAGAMALFGEKYGDEVRVVNMGLGDNDVNYSVELCGGTHVKATGDIGLFKITKESAVSSGVRRIEAVTASGAFDYVNKLESSLSEVAGSLKVSSEDVAARVGQLVEERKKLEQQLKEAKKQIAMGGGGAQQQEEAAEDIGGVSFIGKVLPEVLPKDLKGLVDEYKSQHEAAVITLVATNEGKASIVVGVKGKDDISAVDLVRVGSEALGGKGGGGRPDLAQAGGPNAAAANDAIAAIKAQLNS